MLTRFIYVTVGTLVLGPWFTSSAAHAAPQYNIVALDVLPGGLDSLAFGLNDVGQVVGDSRLDRSTHIGQSRPVVWDYTGQPTELWSDPLIGGSLRGINNAGQIVGRYGSGSGIPLPGPGVPFGRGFVWDATSGRRDLGLAPVGNSQAVAINDAGQVVGTSEVLMDVEIEPGNVVSQFIPRAFIWDENNGIQDIGTLGGLGAFANDINHSGQVVGQSTRSDGSSRAFVWDAVAGMRELPTTGGGSQAIAINDFGQVLGYDGIGAVIWDVPSGNTLPVPGGLDLNNLGHIVGYAPTFGNPTIWDPTHGSQFLSDLIVAGTGWQLQFAVAINDAADIAGYGRLGDERRAFVMTPVPEPPSAALVVGMVLIAIFFGRSLGFRTLGRWRRTM